ncbi:MAG: hypothetical protein AABX14_03200 [Candidatus Aenigmatarchaeota archaeon]
MNIEEHKRALKESLEEIRFAIQQGIDKKQRTLGFNCSLAAIDMLEIYLHSKGLLDPGAMIKHEFFSSVTKAKDRLKSNFENKDNIIRSMVELENKRNILIYGKKQKHEILENYIETFNKIKKLFVEMGVEYE